MRGGIGRQLRSRATVSRGGSKASDGQGGWTETSAVIATDVACRRRPAGEAEQTIAEQVSAEIAHVVYFLVDQDIKRGDVVAVDGYSLKVELVLQPSEPRFQTAACTETQKGS